MKPMLKTEGVIKHTDSGFVVSVRNGLENYKIEAFDVEYYGIGFDDINRIVTAVVSPVTPKQDGLDGVVQWLTLSGWFA